MSNDRRQSNGVRQSDVLVGVALLLIAAVFAYLGFSQPKVSNDYTVEQTTAQVYSPEFDTTVQENSATSQYYENNDYEVVSSTADNDDGISVSFPLNLNTCTKEELMEIDGIGEVRADAIIAYRAKLGGYSSVEQLKDISGIGDKTFEKIAPYVTV
uniref:ComEA family DNA-binding protein n=1 Tax=Eubacterium sp. TaxID=142586 RepID=UPI004025B3DE